MLWIWLDKKNNILSYMFAIFNKYRYGCHHTIESMGCMCHVQHDWLIWCPVQLLIGSSGAGPGHLYRYRILQCIFIKDSLSDSLKMYHGEDKSKSYIKILNRLIIPLLNTQTHYPGYLRDITFIAKKNIDREVWVRGQLKRNLLKKTWI